MLPKNEALICEYLSAHGSSSMAAISQELAVPARTLRDAMQRLIAEGVVTTAGAKRNRTYTLTDTQP